MPLFQTDAERQRKENLKRLEDKRLRFAQELDARGFHPERMLFCSREDGTYVALARHEGRLAVIEAPKFDTDDDFVFDLVEAPRFEREQIFIKGSGLNGAFGFGEKGAQGFNLYIDCGELRRVMVPVVRGRNSWMEARGRKNPLLQTKRRRNDANVVWEFLPIDSRALEKMEAMLADYYLK